MTSVNHPIVLYFDEANALHQLFTGDGVSYYTALCTALDALNGKRAFGIFLSTKSNLANFAPPVNHHDSHRVHGVNHLLAPFTELPFDVHHKFPITEVTWMSCTRCRSCPASAGLCKSALSAVIAHLADVEYASDSGRDTRQTRPIRVNLNRI